MIPENSFLKEAMVASKLFHYFWAGNSFGKDLLAFYWFFPMGFV